MGAVWVNLDERRVEEIHLHKDLDPLKPALGVPRVGLLGFEPRTAGL